MCGAGAARLVDLVGRHVLELGQPVAHVRAVGVVVLRLLDDVEAVDAASGQPRRRDPVAPVRADVVVEQERLEVLGALAPVELQVEGEVGGDVLPPALRHEAGRLELAHVCVDERHAELAILPALEHPRVGAPRLVRLLLVLCTCGTRAPPVAARGSHARATARTWTSSPRRACRCASPQSYLQSRRRAVLQVVWGAGTWEPLVPRGRLGPLHHALHTLSGLRVSTLFYMTRGA